MHGEREDVCSLTPLRGLGDVCSPSPLMGEGRGEGDAVEMGTGIVPSGL